MPTDEELIKEINQGSQAAMEVLVKRHYQMVFAYVYRKVSDYHTAYDLTQEIFIKMMTAMKGYRHQGRFSHWLLTIAVNHCRDYFRSRAFNEKNKEQKLSYYIKDERKNVWDLLSKKMESERVRQALNELPDFQKETIILRFYHDLKIKEIAEITNSK